MPKQKKQETQAVEKEQAPSRIVGFKFVPNLLTINVNEIAFILHKIGLSINTKTYSEMGELQKYWAPVFEEVQVENVKQEAEGAEAPATSS